MTTPRFFLGLEGADDLGGHDGREAKASQGDGLGDDVLGEAAEADKVGPDVNRGVEGALPDGAADHLGHGVAKGRRKDGAAVVVVVVADADEGHQDEVPWNVNGAAGVDLDVVVAGVAVEEAEEAGHVYDGVGG